MAMNRFLRFSIASLFGKGPVHNLSSLSDFDFELRRYSYSQIDSPLSTIRYDFRSRISPSKSKSERRLESLCKGPMTPDLCKKSRKKQLIAMSLKIQKCKCMTNNRWIKIVVPILVTYGGFLQLNIING